MLGGDSGRRLLVAALVVLVGTGCGLGPNRVSSGEVRAMEEWLAQQPQVVSVSTERGSDFRSGLPGKDEWARTRVDTALGTTPEELLALGEALRERDDSRTIDDVVAAQVGGLSLYLGRSPEQDARSVQLLVAVREALGDTRTYPQPERYSQDPPAVTIDREITVWVERGDLDDAAAALSSIVPPEGEQVTVRVDTVTEGPHRVFVVGGELGAASQGALAAIEDLRGTGLRPSLVPHRGHGDVMELAVQVERRDQWDIAVAALAEHAPEAVLSTILPEGIAPGVSHPVEIRLSLSEMSAETARTLPELVGSVPDPWPVSRVELGPLDEGLVTVGRTEHDLEDVEALVDVPDWALSAVVTSYRFAGVNDGAAAESHLVLPARGPVDASFLAIHRSVDHADRVHPDVGVTLDGVVRVEWPAGRITESELRPVLEELRGEWVGQRIHVTQLDEHRRRTTVSFETSGRAEAQHVRALGGAGGDAPDPLDELGWVVDLWNASAG